MEELSPRIHEVEQSLIALSQDALKNEEARKKLLDVIQQQTVTLESPLEVIWRMMMEPHQSASLRAAMAMGLLEPIIASKKTLTAADLAIITNCNKQLIVRIMRPLCTLGIVEEVAYESYSSNPKTEILSVPAVGNGFKFMFDVAATAVTRMPDFLVQSGFKNPEGPLGNFQYAFNTDLQMFPWLMQRPEHMKNFNDLMAGSRQNRIDWFDFAPVEKILFERYEESSALLVDIGGGRGHDLEAFRNRFPTSGKLILQDLPPVIEDIDGLHEDVVRMKYDFFTPQPVKGARAYYLRYILHDYPDSTCRKILNNIVAAMTPGYSKLLTFEWILPDVAAPLYPALLDINMLALLSGMERTVTQWKELLDSVGLEVLNFWSLGKETEGLIEAVRKQ